MQLTAEQKDAVLTINGNIVTMASAGSGKTGAFVTRLAFMIKQHKINPSNILAVTFTKKASEEMRKRLTKMVGKDLASRVPMGTFHSICYRLLKALDPNDFGKLKIAPDWWKFSLLNDMCKMGEDRNPNGLNLGIKGSELSSFISYQKSNGVKPYEQVIIDDNVDYAQGVSRMRLQEAFDKYEQLKEQSRQIDFDDMLVIMHDKLKSNYEFRKRMQSQFQYIMIDEFQDTSSIVLDIVKMINNRNVFVVGDFRQSIYKFINANVENILNFKNEFDDVKVIELNKNFRSTQNIVGISNQIIANSPVEMYKEYKPSESVAEVGEPIYFNIYQDEMAQIDRIGEALEEMRDNGDTLKEIAILVRTNAQTALLETTLADRDIPYDVSKAQSFFDRKEILDILSYARVAVDSTDDASFRRIYNAPNRYLSKQSLERLDAFASERDMSLIDAVKHSPQNSDWKFKKNIDSLTDIVDELKYQVQTNVNAGRILRNIIKSTRYMNYINDTTTSPNQIIEKSESLEKLCEMGAKFPTIRAFLAHISKVKEKQKKAKGTDAVQILTIHSSKGLEWDTVFVINCNEGLIPHEMNSDIEEERRLFYVACSRPRKHLFISWFVYDSDAEVKKEGQFITELLGKDKTTKMRKEVFKGLREVTHLYQP